MMENGQLEGPNGGQICPNGPSENQNWTISAQNRQLERNDPFLRATPATVTKVFNSTNYNYTTLHNTTNQRLETTYNNNDYNNY